MSASWILVVEYDRRLAATLERVLSAEGPLASAPPRFHPNGSGSNRSLISHLLTRDRAKAWNYNQFKGAHDLKLLSGTRHEAGLRS